jgi:hypothetical protein
MVELNYVPLRWHRLQRHMFRWHGKRFDGIDIRLLFSTHSRSMEPPQVIGIFLCCFARNIA